ncbi:unnamed protein product [Adineta ricciae]|uniref:Class I SAM-dependent methyltransferase n=1 Tax=Adineta ricciae TaxID=249248 RepID=A0A814IV46_ADIRI|nr:unnamed protein product [Adineta ricciae]CAF1563428.1 unnamed protein product [Adineta ricciae]
MILKSEVHQTSSSNRVFVKNLTVSTKSEITLTELDSKYLTSKGRLHHYTRFYEHYLSKYRNTYFRLLEIGLGCGMAWGVGVSAALWREYFGPMADIHFIEYDKQCGEKWSKQIGQQLNITIHYGSQDDKSFLQSFAENFTNSFDVIIDDGGHRMIQQINSLAILFPTALRSGGIYSVEDLYTSYLTEYDGGYLKSSTFIEYLKKLIDDIQSKSPTYKQSVLGRLVHSLEISDKICLFTKK